jgi:hypothetical protein
MKGQAGTIAKTGSLLADNNTSSHSLFDSQDNIKVQQQKVVGISSNIMPAHYFFLYVSLHLPR